MNYNYLIVEDQLGSLKNLQTALKSHPNFIEIGVANTLAQGISLTYSTKPHLIFLDVQLGNENGFDLIKEIRQHTTEIPFIIMTTDFSEHAKTAVNSDVLYFLDKPIDPDELVLGLHRFEKRFLELQNHITIKNTEGHFFMQLDSIQYIKSDNNYCTVFRENERPMSVTKTLKDMERILPMPFIRVHKSYIVNTKYVQMLNTTKKMLRLNIRNCEDSCLLELPISDLYLEKVRATLLTTQVK